MIIRSEDEFGKSIATYLEESGLISLKYKDGNMIKVMGQNLNVHSSQMP